MENVLHLTLKRNWFVLMLNGVKKQEYRKPTRWMKVRLENKSYDVIKFVNGYGNDKPFFVCEYNGFEIAKDAQTLEFDGNLINVDRGDYVIQLGQVVDYGNLAVVNTPLNTQQP